MGTNLKVRNVNLKKKMIEFKFAIHFANFSACDSEFDTAYFIRFDEIEGTSNFQNFCHFCLSDYWVRNNGHTVQVNLNEKPTSDGRMTGYGFDRPYIFAQVHLHT